jgi:regulator of cell morphogenesis and NO signaling
LEARHPSYACVLEQHGIDYCCGGKATLEEACGSIGLNVESLLKKFALVDQKNDVSNELDWTSTSLKQLTEHIVEAYHNPLRLELSRILPLATCSQGKQHTFSKSNCFVRFCINETKKICNSRK